MHLLVTISLQVIGLNGSTFMILEQVSLYHEIVPKDEKGAAKDFLLNAVQKDPSGRECGLGGFAFDVITKSRGEIKHDNRRLEIIVGLETGQFELKEGEYLVKVPEIN